MLILHPDNTTVPAINAIRPIRHRCPMSAPPLQYLTSRMPVGPRFYQSN